MALLYDSFGIRRVEVLVNFWPDIDRFLPGDLSKLLGELNGDDLFTSSEFRPDSGARFEGEHWVYDLSLTSVLVRCTSYSTPQELRARIRDLLEGTRRYFGGRQSVAFFSDDVRVGGTVPEDKARNVGEGGSEAAAIASEGRGSQPASRSSWCRVAPRRGRPRGLPLARHH